MQIDTILYPTDFSLCSLNALNYASAIAETFYSKLVIIHIPTGKGDVGLKFDHKSEVGVASKRLMELKLECLQKNSLLNISTVLLPGGPHNVLDFIREENIDLVVMGTKGSSNTEVGMGSFTSVIMEGATCPVLAIPDKAFIPSMCRFVYASDLDSVDIDSIKALTRFASYYNAEVTILNISDQSRRFTEEQLYNFEKKVRETAGYPKLDFIYFHGSDLNRHIQEYLKRNKADLFVKTSLKKSLINKVLVDKESQKVKYQSYVPLLNFRVSDSYFQKVA